jgi:micrococcal nuclease
VEDHEQSKELPDGASGGPVALVSRVVDGDTVEVRLHGQVRSVRLIGVDTPETVAPGQPVECYGAPASRYTTRILEGERVHLEFDEERNDHYGRLLAYVWSESTLFNRRLVARGLATVAIYPPNDKYEARLITSEERALAANRGLWDACAQGQRRSRNQGGTAPRRGPCDSNYMGACVARYPPDLDCPEVSATRFESVGDDPHGFDGDHDGVACEG